MGEMDDGRRFPVGRREGRGGSQVNYHTVVSYKVGNITRYYLFKI